MGGGRNPVSPGANSNFVVRDNGASWFSVGLFPMLKRSDPMVPGRGLVLHAWIVEEH